MYAFSSARLDGNRRRLHLVLAAFVAILIAGTAISAPQEQSSTEKADRLQSDGAGSAQCDNETWPYISRKCLDNQGNDGNAGVDMRYVTVDRIVAPNTTALIRLPVAAGAEIR